VLFLTIERDDKSQNEKYFALVFFYWQQESNIAKVFAMQIG